MVNNCPITNGESITYCNICPRYLDDCDGNEDWICNFKPGDIIEDIGRDDDDDYQYCKFTKLEGPNIFGHWATTLKDIYKNKTTGESSTPFIPENFKLIKIKQINWRERLTK